MQERQKTWVWSLGREDPQEEGMATHSSILAWRVPWTEAPGGVAIVYGVAWLHDWSDLAKALHFLFSKFSVSRVEKRYQSQLF